MKPKEGRALNVGSTTPDTDVDGPLFVDPEEGPTIVVTTDDAVMTPTKGVEEAT